MSLKQANQKVKGWMGKLNRVINSLPCQHRHIGDFVNERFHCKKLRRSIPITQCIGCKERKTKVIRY